LLSVLLGSANWGFASVPVGPHPNGGWGAVWSPQGDRIAFLSSADGLPAEAWVCDPQGASFRRLTHGGADDLGWSADGRSLTFATRRRGRPERWQADLDSGSETPVETALHAPPGSPQALSPDGNTLAYLVSADKSRDLYLIAAGQQTPRRLTTDFTVDSFCWSPTGDKIAFDAVNRLSHNLPQVWIYDLATRKIAHLGTAGSFGPAWSADGSCLAYRVMYSEGADRVAVVTADGAHGQLIEDLLYQGDGLAWSPVADVLAVVVRDAEEQQVWLVGADGKVGARLSRAGMRFRLPVWSPDGTHIAFEGVQTGVSSFSEVWVADAGGKEWACLTPSQPSYWELSPAGGRLFFLSDVAGVTKAWTLGADSPATPPVALPDTDGAAHVVASPRGDRILVIRTEDVMILSADGKRLGSLPLRGAVEAAWSPRGDRIALGLKSGPSEDTIRLLAAAADGTLSETGSLPGSNPSWRPDGGALAFVRANLVWRADADGGNPTALATIPVAGGEEAVVQRPAWDLKGEAVAFAVTRSRQQASWQQELWLLRGDSPVRIYREEAATEFALSPQRWSALPAWTADGRVLFSSDRGGTPQAWSIRPDGSDLRAITPPGAIWCALGPDGLHFVRLDSETPLWKVSADGTNLVPLAWKH
jgi:Tol biopolymer transport system component